jgi:serine/threonine protein kinase/WD40 repeat protein/Tfp pilus assembly protein PilF
MAMTVPLTSASQTRSAEYPLADLIEELSARLEAGEPTDLSRYLKDHPEHAAELRRLFPALQLLADFSRSGTARAPLPTGDGPEFPAARDLGDFRILREIGRGGMGVVYEAEQLSLGRRVALKVLPFASTLDAKHLQRFKNEAQAAAHLHHQNIVPVYATGCERGVHFYAMQFIEGQTLATLIRELRQLAGLEAQAGAGSAGAASALAGELASGRWAPARRHGTDPQPTTAFVPAPEASPVPPAATATPAVAARSTERSATSPAFFRTVANLGIQAAEALEHAHQLGVIHRDIKPANLLVDAGGRLWVTDFGLAHCQSQAGLTMSGDLVGTLRYMSPEQALAQRVTIDHRTDIYSLGVTLYELLTLEPAFSGRDRQELLRQIAFEEPKAPRRLNPAIPSELETIILKASEKNPSERYATAQELADDLERYLRDEPIRARRPSVVMLVRKWMRRHKPVVVTGLLAGAILLVAVTLITLVAAGRLREQLDETKKAQREGQYRLYHAKLAEAKASRWSGRAGRKFDGLAALAEAARLAHDLDLGPDEMVNLRNEAIACMALVDLRLDHKWPGYPPGSTLTGTAFDAQMERYARVEDNGHITVRRLVDNQEMLLIKDTGAPASPHSRMRLVFSPDGQFLAASGNAGSSWPGAPIIPLQLWDLRGPKSILKSPGAGGFERTIDFSPDSRILAARSPDQSSIVLYDIQAAKELKRFSIGSPVTWLHFHPQKQELAVCIGPQVRVCDLDGRPVIAPLSHPRRLEAVAWSRDGRLLATACEDGQAYIWDAASGKQLAACKGHDGVQHVAFNQRGDLLASVGLETTQLWDAQTGKELLSADGLATEFSDHDRWLGLGVFGADVGRWEVAIPREYRSLHGHPREAVVSSLDVSPDGRLLASAGNDGVRIWELATGKAVAFLPTGAMESVIFDRAGRFLITGGSLGVHRWPIRREANQAGTWLRLGPAQAIRGRHARPTHQVSLSADGRVLAGKTIYSRAVILDLERPNEKPRRINHPVSWLGLSPDGKWLATNADNAFESKLWDASNGKWVRDFTGMRSARIAFSPDNQWLVIAAAREYRFYRVGSWEPGPRLTRAGAGHSMGHVAFTRDGKMAAIASSPRLIQLIDPASGCRLATLAAPVPEELHSLCFTPDGERLLAGTAHGGIQLWDLRRIREQLRALRLDWDPHADPPRHKAVNHDPIQVELDLGKLPPAWLGADPRVQVGISSFLLALNPFNFQAYLQRGRAHAALGEQQKAIADYTTYLALLPAGDPRRAEAILRRAGNYALMNDQARALADLCAFVEGNLALAAELHEGAAQLCNDLAWLNVTGPEKARDPMRALLLAKKAVELSDDDATMLNTLGVVYYRLGKYSEAVETLQRSRREGTDDAAPVDFFFLAMCHARLGHADKARQCYDEAVRLTQKRQDKGLAQWKKELNAFRAEAADVLGIQKKK